MTDEHYKEMILTHDKHIDRMSSSIETLAGSMGETNKKLDGIIDVISTQNVLIERFNNLEENLKESFGRVHGKIQVLEEAHSTTGCAKMSSVEMSIKSVGRSLDDVRNQVKIVEEHQENSVSSSTVKWVGGFLLTYSILFGTYVVEELHRMDQAQITQQYKQEGDKYSQELVNKNNEVAVDNLKAYSHESRELINRNYGFMKGKHEE